MRPLDAPLAIEGGTPIRRAFLPFGRPRISEEEIAAVADVLRSGWLGMGERTLEFERAFADYCGAGHAVAVSSCTAGLHLSLAALDVGPGDEVVTTPMTFAATVNAILAVGATPVLVDIDPRTLNVEPAAVAAAITPRTRALLPVHFGGRALDLTGLGALARERGLSLVEDAAHAVGARHAGARVGGHGHLVSFSFYPNKNMTTIEGGMVTTNDAALAESLALLRIHGLSNDAWKRYHTRRLVTSQVVRFGFKANLTDVQAALGLGQLARLEEFLALRERYAAIYDEALADLPLDRQARPEPGADRHGLHLYVVLLRLDELTCDRDQVVRALRAENIGVGLHYQAIHEHPYYAGTLGYARGAFPVAEDVSARTLTLPLGPGMDEDDLRDVVHALRCVLTRYRAPAAERS